MTSSGTLRRLQHSLNQGEIPKADFIAKCHTVHETLWEYASHLAHSGIHEIRVTDTGVHFLMGDERIWIEAPGCEPRSAPLEALNFGGYEPAECHVMNALAANAKCIVDVGANIGFHAVRLAAREPAAEVHAFEPMPQHFRFLCRNLAGNAAGLRCRAYNFALSRENGSFPFFVAPRNGTNASLANVAQRDDVTRVVGLAMTLDQWSENYGARPDFLKIDVEGAELWVLEGGKRTIDETKPRIFAEILRKWSSAFGYHPNTLIGMLATLGYGCWAVHSQGVRRVHEITDHTSETNFAFLHEGVHEEYIQALTDIGMVR